MGFFGSRRGAEQWHAARTTALVVEAAAPPEGTPSLGPGSHGTVRVLADLGSGRRVYDRKIRMTETHWLVPGMEVEVTFALGRPDRSFDVDWDALPSMEARAAAGDPALADPIGARRKIAHALGLTQAETGTARTERFQRALEQAGTLPAPPGKLRAVALIATIRGRRRIVGDPDNAATHDQVTYERDSAAVLSVSVPGRPPYALYMRRFKCRIDLLEPLWMPLPALVSDDDPAGVEILWEDVPGHDAQLADRIAASQTAQQARAAQVDAFSAHALPERAQIQQLGTESARRTLQYVRDPAMRKLLIDQYRAAGIDVDEHA